MNGTRGGKSDAGETVAALGCPPAGSALRGGDATVIDLLRVEGSLGISSLAESLGVTATAVRQRLDRLMRHGLIERTCIGGRRGRPAHVYSLTDAGHRFGGDSFRDLALVLWRELRSIRQPAVRKGLLARVGASLAALHRDRIAGSSPPERIRSLADHMRLQNIACAVEPGEDGAADLPVLTSYACPYPDLAEQDRGICAAERLMIQDLVGGAVRLKECRLDGAACCRFALESDTDGELAAAVGDSVTEGGEGGRPLRSAARPRRMPTAGGETPRSPRPARERIHPPASPTPAPESIR